MSNVTPWLMGEHTVLTRDKYITQADTMMVMMVMIMMIMMMGMSFIMMVAITSIEASITQAGCAAHM